MGRAGARGLRAGGAGWPGALFAALSLACAPDAVDSQRPGDTAVAPPARACAPGPDAPLPAGFDAPVAPAAAFTSILPLDPTATGWGPDRQDGTVELVEAPLGPGGAPRLVALRLAHPDGRRHPVLALQDGTLVVEAALADLLPGVEGVDPLAIADLDGDDVVEVVTTGGLWRAGVLSPWTWPEGCAPDAAITAVWVSDVDADDDVELLVGTGRDGLACGLPTFAFVEVLSDPTLRVRVAAGDEVHGPDARHVGLYTLGRWQSAPGRAPWALAVGYTDLPGVAPWDLAEHHSGLYRRDPEAWVAADPLPADAPLRLDTDFAALAAAVGADNAGDGLGGLLETLFSESELREVATAGEVWARMDARLEASGAGCVEDFASPRAGARLTRVTPMASVAADWDGDGALEVIVSADWPHQIVLDDQGDGVVLERSLEAGVITPYVDDAPGTMGAPGLREILWGAWPCDLDRDGAPDLCAVAGWDDRTYRAGHPPQRVHAWMQARPTPQSAPGTLAPFVNVSAAVTGDLPRASWWSLCPTDLDEDGDIDLAVGTSSGIAGAPHGPMWLRDDNPTPRSLTVSLPASWADTFVEVTRRSGAVVRMSATPVATPGVWCAPLVGVTWPEADPPAALAVRTPGGALRWSTSNAADLAAGQRIEVGR